jgi:hypothetical protein
MFERTPVWLLALDAELGKHVWIMGVPDSTAFYEALESSLVDTKLAHAAINNISSEQVSYSKTLVLKPDTVVLASGSFKYVRRWLLYICSLALCSKQLRNASDL